MNYRRTTGLLLAGILIALVPSLVAGAGPEIFGLQTSGDVELGGRVFTNRPPEEDRAKFEEYRDLPESAFLQYLRLRGDSKDDFYTVEILGFNGGQDDQNFQLRSYGVGTFDFLFEWDETPHLLSTTSRTLTVQSSPGDFTVPGCPLNCPPLASWNTAPLIDELGFRTDTAVVAGSFSPSPDWDIGVEWNRRFKHGDRPLALPFGTPGSNALELPVPIDETINGVHLNVGYAGEGYQLQFGYDFSIFDNDLTGFISDNPCKGPLSGCSAGNSGAAAPEQGRGALFPDNYAMTFSLAGGVNLPMKTRLTGSFSYSFQKQDQDFLPFTINGNLTNPAGNPNCPVGTPLTSSSCLPATNLDGNVNIFLLNLSATSRPMDDMTATAKFRLYRYDDSSSTIFFPLYVEDDRSVQTVTTGGPLRAQSAKRFPYTKLNAGGDVRYQLFKPVAVKVGFDWEHWDRSANALVLPFAGVSPETGGDAVLNVPRELETTNEYTPRVMLDLTPADWLLVRLSYAYSTRNGSDYLQATEDQYGLLRKYDMADRNRQRVDVLADLFAMDNLTFTTTFNYAIDNYPSTAYGLQEGISWAAGIDGSWKPLEWLNVFAGYVHEEWDANSRQKFRRTATGPGGACTVALCDELDNPTFDWQQESKDIYDTVRAGVMAELIPKKLDGGANFNYSIGHTDMNAFNPVTPTCANCTFASSADAEDFPGITNDLLHFDVFLRYWITEHFTAKVNFTWENYNTTDFREDNLMPVNASTGDVVFLGNDPQSYTASWFTLSVGYHF